MAMSIFTNAIENGTEINLFNDGAMIRDFTYVQDIVQIIAKIIDKPPKEEHTMSKQKSRYSIYNIGGGQYNSVKYLLNLLETELGRRAKVVNKNIQNGDVYTTYASIDKLVELLPDLKMTSLESGVKKYIKWYKSWSKK